MSVSDNYTVTSQQCRKALLAAFNVKRPIFIWGPPGIGKSETVAQVTAELGGHMIDLRMAQMEPTDIRGIPFFNKELGKMDWAPPIELPDHELASQYPVVVLFLDEMNSAAPAVQAAGYQLILNRRIGKYVLPDNVVIVAAGNRESDKGVTYRMPTPLANRFVHIEMRVDFDSFYEWAIMNNVHSDILGYLMRNKKDLCDFDSRSSSKSFPTPRSWSFVSDLLSGNQDIDADTMFSLIAGSIGEGLASKFATHRKFVAELPDPLDVLNGRVTDLKVNEVSAQYSLAVNLCYELKEMHSKKTVTTDQYFAMLNNFFSFMMHNFETELVIMGSRTALKTYQLPINGSKLACFDDFYKKYGKFVLEA